jgi:hypothetical protein
VLFPQNGARIHKTPSLYLFLFAVGCTPSSDGLVEGFTDEFHKGLQHLIVLRELGGDFYQRLLIATSVCTKAGFSHPSRKDDLCGERYLSHFTRSKPTIPIGFERSSRGNAKSMDSMNSMSALLLSIEEQCPEVGPLLRHRERERDRERARMCQQL